MLPLILVAVGAYLIGDSILGDKKYAKGGKTQGYDDKEDERLAMEHGKMSKKDLDSTHARRDDARFEERGKMAKGGKTKGVVKISTSEISDIDFQSLNDIFDSNDAMFSLDESEEYVVMDLNELPDGDDKDDVSEILGRYNVKKYAKGGKLVGKQKNLDVNKNGKLDAEDFKMLRGKKMADGGETKMPYKEFEETLREYEIEGGFGKTIEKGYEMYYLPKGNPYLNTKFNHRNKKKAYQQYVKMDR